MALQSDLHKERVERRVKEQLPRLDPVALEELGMTQAECEDLERKLRGYIVLPGMPDYPAAAAPHAAPRWPAFPQLIAFCETPSDVRICLELAQEKALWAVPRSGRHSLANYSTCSGMIIDVSLMNGISRRPDRADRAGRRGRELRPAQRGARRLQPARPGRDVRGRRRRRVHAGRRLRAHLAPVRRSTATACSRSR